MDPSRATPCHSATVNDPIEPKRTSKALLGLVRWVDSYAGAEPPPQGEPDRVDWVRCIPFIAMHVGCLAIFRVGWSWTAVCVAVALYLMRGFAITGFYHRYFSHRTFRTSRACQLVFAVIGNASGQRGPLWWAAHHRYHHVHSDDESDIHSPRRNGFLWSHMGWFTSRRNFRTDQRAVADLAGFPELVFLDRFDALAPAALAMGLFAAGEILRRSMPGLGTPGLQMLVWGFCVSTMALFHVTSMVNSVAHKIGRRRYDTGDESGNSFLLALITLGEGWHNNHHHYPASARQGFQWWEIDITYYGLALMSWLGLVWDLRPLPERMRRSGRLGPAAA